MVKSDSEPFEVFLGAGRVLIASYSTPKGVRGIVLRDTGVKHEIGSLAAESDYQHEPIPGEVYIRCETREAALVLLEQVARVVASFSEPVLSNPAGHAMDEIDQHVEQQFQEYAQAYKLDLRKHDDDTWVSDIAEAASTAFFGGWNCRNDLGPE